MTAFIISEGKKEIILAGKNLTEIISEKLTSEEIDISYNENFSEIKAFPIILYPSDILTDENLSEIAGKLSSSDDMIFLTKDNVHGIKIIGKIPESKNFSKFKVKRIIPQKNFFVINSRESFLSAQKFILTGEKHIGKSTILGKNSYISDNSSVGKNVYIGENTKIINSCIENNAYISENVTIENSIVCENANIGCGEKIIGKIISKNILPPKKKMFGSDGKLSEISSHEAFCMGKNISGKKIFCAYSENACDIFESFCMSASENNDIVNFGNISENILRFAIQKGKCNFGLYFSADYIRCWESDSLYSGEKLKKLLEKCINQSREFPLVSHKLPSIPYKNIIDEYQKSLDEIYNVKESKVFADIYCKGCLKAICTEFVQKNNLTNRDNPRISFSIDESGLKVCAYSEETGYVPHEKLIMLCMTREKNPHVSVPENFPEVTDKIIKTERISVNPDYDKMSDSEAKRDLSARKNALPMYFDAVKILARILKILNEENISFYELTKSIPEYSHSGRIIHVNDKSEKIFKKLNLPESGGKLKTEHGKARLFPLRTGGIFLTAESMSLEISAEICDEASEILKKLGNE